jgi:hypothetical protein
MGTFSVITHLSTPNLAQMLSIVQNYCAQIHVDTPYTPAVSHRRGTANLFPKSTKNKYITNFGSPTAQEICSNYFIIFICNLNSVKNM